MAVPSLIPSYVLPGESFSVPKAREEKYKAAGYATRPHPSSTDPNDPNALVIVTPAGGSWSPLPRVSTPKEPATEPAILSTASGEDSVRNWEEWLSRFSAKPAPEAPAGTKDESKVTFIKPDTEQTYTIPISALTAEIAAGLRDKGFEVAEAAGDVPSYLLTGSKADEELAATERELKNLKAGLSSFMVSGDALAAQIGGITGQYDARVQDMREINRRRARAIETLGVRLGSRYTGGEGGVWGGIISEEERQGATRISDLEAQKQSAISEAREAASTKNWQVYGKIVEMVEKIYAEQKETAKELNAKIAEENKKIREQKIQSSRDSAIVDLAQQLSDEGVTDEGQLAAVILQYLNFREDGTPTGGDFTFKEVDDILQAIKKETKSENLPADIKEWKYLLELGEEGGGLPKGTTFLQYQRMKRVEKATADQKVLAYDEIKQKAAGLFEENRRQNADRMVSPDLYEQARNELKALGLGDYLDDFDRAFKDKLSEESRARFGIPEKSDKEEEGEPSWLNE